MKNIIIDGIEYELSVKPKSDYKILSFKSPYAGKNDVIFYSDNGKFVPKYEGALLNSYSKEYLMKQPTAKIHSVKRLSDGEVFTVNENTNYINKISGFAIENDRLSVEMEDKYGAKWTTNIQSLVKEKEPLFTTGGDNVPIYHKDKYFSVTDDFEIVFSDALKGLHLTPQIISRSFSTEEKAKEYILMNKPCLSLNDVLSCSSHAKISEDNPHYLNLKKLAIQKING